ncbi:MAG: 50S ribosomal protein L13 [Candidatus Methanomethylicaceae archaeon]
MPEIIYIDGTDLRLGRMATSVAKHLMNGNKVVIVNAEKAVVSGSRRSALSKYSRWMRLKTYKNPEKVGPKQHRPPDRLVHSAIKNMLPKSPSGKEALKRLKVYIGVPKELQSAKFLQVEEAHIKNLRGPYMRLEEISKSLGWSV